MRVDVGEHIGVWIRRDHLALLLVAAAVGGAAFGVLLGIAIFSSHI